MAKQVNLSLTGDAASFVKTMEKEGLSDSEIVGRALELFRMAWTHDKKLAVVDSENKPTIIINVDPKAQ